MNIGDDKADRIYAKWSDKTVDRGSVVDLGLKNFKQLGQIKGIDFQEIAASSGDDEKQRKWEEETRKWNEYVARCKAENAEQKARRIINTFCKLLWVVRGNLGQIEEGSELHDDLMIRLISYFSENPHEWHATGDIYGDLIPFGTRKVPVSNTPGMKTIGQMMMNPPEVKDDKQKAVCDICGKKFTFEGERPLFCPKCEKEEMDKDLDIPEDDLPEASEVDAGEKLKS